MSVFLKKGFLFLIVMFVLAFLVFSFVRTEATSSQSAPDFGNIFSLFSLPGQEIGGYEVEAYFCPEDECSSKLIAELDKAQSTIQIAIYSFTLDDIADALIRARVSIVKMKDL